MEYKMKRFCSICGDILIDTHDIYMKGCEIICNSCHIARQNQSYNENISVIINCKIYNLFDLYKLSYDELELELESICCEIQNIENYIDLENVKNFMVRLYNNNTYCLSNSHVYLIANIIKAIKLKLEEVKNIC